jgi:NAD(P)-dependent dehydrogenase (short-subunit alcohol dehydrogenase family)
MFDVHVQGAHRVLRAAHPLLVRSDRAAVCLTSSIAARVGVNTRVSYCAAKSAVEGMVRGLATEWASDRIRVNGVAPGYTDTPLMREAEAAGRLDVSHMLSRVPMRRVASTSEIAAVMAFLISDQASYITGQVIAVDGGLTTSGDW